MSILFNGACTLYGEREREREPQMVRRKEVGGRGRQGEKRGAANTRPTDGGDDDKEKYAPIFP